MMFVGDAFAPLRFALERAEVRYAVDGSWASAAFGEPRFTNDVDILADFTPEKPGSVSRQPTDGVQVRFFSRCRVSAGH
jgi:hypothetical protein